MKGISFVGLALAESGGERTIRALRHPGDMRFEPKNRTQVMNLDGPHEIHDLRGGDRGHAAQMAHRTIVVERAQLAVGIALIRAAGLELGAFMLGFVLVFVMPKMRRKPACFVLAIACRRRPGELERQQDQQKDRQPAAHHGSISSELCSDFRAAQQAQPIRDHEQACTHVGEHGHPHAGVPEHRQQQEDGLDAQRQTDVLPQDGMGSA